jgi:hypothetical protein
MSYYSLMYGATLTTADDNYNKYYIKWKLYNKMEYSRIYINKTSNLKFVSSN